MTTFNNLETVSVCCLSLRLSMNLRKSRFSYGKKINLSCKDIKSSVKKGKKSSRYAENTKSLSKIPAKFQNSILDLDEISVVRRNSRSSANINLVTSTPILQERKRVSRLLHKCDSSEKTRQKSFKRISSPITSSPIQKTRIQIKPCEIKLTPVIPKGKVCSSPLKLDYVLRNNKKSSKKELPSALLNSPVEISKENMKSTRNSMSLRSQNVSKNMSDDMSHSQKSKTARKVSVTQKSVKRLIACEKDLQFENKKCGKKLSNSVRKLSLSSASKDASSVSVQPNETLISKKFPVEEITQASRDNLFQSYHDADNSRSSRYSLRNSFISQNKSYCEKKEKNEKKPSTRTEKLLSSLSSTPKSAISAKGKSNKVSRKNKNSLNLELSQHSHISLSELNNETVEKISTPTSRSSLLQSYRENDNSKSKYSLRNSSVSQNKSYSEKKKKDKKRPSSCTKKLLSTPKIISAEIKSNKISRKSKNSVNLESSQHLHVSQMSQSNNETETSKPFRQSLRLQYQDLSKRTVDNKLSSESNLMSEAETESSEKLIEPSSNNTKRLSKHSANLKHGQSSKNTTINKSVQHSPKKTSSKKQKLVKAVHQGKTSKSCKKPSSSSKKQISSKKSVAKPARASLNDLEDIPVDDLVLSFDRRKVKSDGFKSPSKNSLKRKRSAIQAIMQADEDYEDDLYESKKFDQFKELLMDTSDSEISYSISTPKFPVTPLIRHKTPKFKDCFSPGEYAISRKAAMEYIYRNKKRKSGQKTPKTPVIPERKKLEYSQVLEDAQKFKKSIENLAYEESDNENDSYFSL